MNNNKVIGIVGGMGPYTGLDLANKIFNQTKTKKSHEHLSIATLSFPSLFSDRTAFLLNQTDSNPAIAIADVIQKLSYVGATIIGIPCNTAHTPKIYEVILETLNKKQVNVTLIHMIKEVGKFIHENHPNTTKVGLLATKGTYVAHLYPDLLKQWDINILPMDEIDQDIIHDIIYNPQDGIKAEPDSTNKVIKNKLFTAVDKLKERGAQAIIMGCTEIPLIFTEKKIGGIDMIDPNLILARAMIRQVDPKMLKPI